VLHTAGASMSVKLLALDCAEESCSVALRADGELVWRASVEPRAQAAHLLPMIDAVLVEAGLALRQLDALVVGRGPGSFTGVRLAVGVAQGLAYGAGLPVIPVSDLAMLAQGAVTHGACTRALACMDARMEEVYWCAYACAADGTVTPLQAETLSAPDAVAVETDGKFAAVGSGWARHPILRTRLAAQLAGWEPERSPHARDALTLAEPLWRAGRALPPEQVLPVYLRDRVATPRG
jgi:tRNA threonylcarbamoyladenosine biosynthesis protein TsaB